jgi:hypothetical protein
MKKLVIAGLLALASITAHADAIVGFEPFIPPVDAPVLLCKVICIAGVDYSYIFHGLGGAAANGAIGGFGFGLLIGAYRAVSCITDRLAAYLSRRRADKNPE